MEKSLLSLSKIQFREMVCSYLQQKRVLQICIDGTIKTLKSDLYLIDRKVVEEAIHGHAKFWYGQRKFVLVMNEEQGRKLKLNKLATYLAGMPILGDVVLLRNYMRLNENED